MLTSDLEKWLNSSSHNSITMDTYNIGEQPTYTLSTGSTSITTDDLAKLYYNDRTNSISFDDYKSYWDTIPKSMYADTITESNKTITTNKGDNNMMENMFDGMFGKIKNGLCRYSLDGKIAIKTATGYKTYDVDTNKLVNCDSFAFDVGADFFFVIPTNKVAVGDIILVNGKPNAVVEKSGKFIKVFNYETSAVQDIVPESHMFMGNSYFYGKIVSLFSGKMGNQNMMKYMMMSQMFGDNKGHSDMNPMMLMMMMNGNADNMFSGIFDCFDDEDTDNSDSNT